MLQSDNGGELTNQVINKLKNMWLELNLVHGKPRQSQSQGDQNIITLDFESQCH